MSRPPHWLDVWVTFLGTLATIVIAVLLLLSACGVVTFR